MRDGPEASGSEPPPVAIPIDGTLDLHTFRPRDIAGLLADYFAACREKGILEVRVIHGKGRGALRRSVHALCERNPAVRSYRIAGGDGGSWGATLVSLAPAGEISPSR